MRWLEKLEEGFLSLMMACMVGITFVQVIARYIFNYSFVWALELVGVLFAWLIFIGLSYGVRVGTHLGIDLLVRRLGPTAARVLGAVVAGLCVVYSCVLAFGGWQYLMKLYVVGIEMNDLPIPQWAPKLVLPLGFGLLALRFGSIFLRLLSGKSARLLGDESEDALKMRDELKESQS